jgi:hypothetical protein
MLNIAQKPKVAAKVETKPTIAKPKARKVMDPKDFKGTYKYDRDGKIQVVVAKNPKREGSAG